MCSALCLADAAYEGFPDQEHAVAPSIWPHSGAQAREAPEDEAHPAEAGSRHAGTGRLRPGARSFAAAGQSDGAYIGSTRRPERRLYPQGCAVPCAEGLAESIDCVRQRLSAATLSARIGPPQVYRRARVDDEGCVHVQDPLLQVREDDFGTGGVSPGPAHPDRALAALGRRSLEAEGAERERGGDRLEGGGRDGDAD